MVKYFLTNYPIITSKLREIVDLVKVGESVTSLWMPHSARTAFAIQLRSKMGLESKERNDLYFGVLDLSLSQEYLDKRFGEVKAEAVREIEQGKRAVIIMDNFSLENADWVKYVISTRHSLPPRSLCFLILAFESEFYAQGTQKTDMSLIYHNIIKMPYFSKDEVFDWLDSRYDKETKQQIFDYCGGIVGLLINLERAIKHYGSIKAAITSEQMKNTVKHLWGRFSERERQLLTSIVVSDRSLPFPFEIGYMKEHRLLDENGQVIGEWIKDVVDRPTEIEVKLEADAIMFNGTNIQTVLTNKETNVIRQLIAKKELSREQISNILWGDKATDNYSDWAIDQIMSRLRKKLDQVGIGGNRIKTAKKIGFKAQGIKVV